MERDRTGDVLVCLFSLHGRQEDNRHFNKPPIGGGTRAFSSRIPPSPPPTPHSGLWRWQWMRAPASVPSHPGYGSRQEARRAVPWGGGLEFGQKQHTDAHAHTHTHTGTRTRLAAGWRRQRSGGGGREPVGEEGFSRPPPLPPLALWPFVHVSPLTLGRRPNPDRTVGRPTAFPFEQVSSPPGV